MIVKKTDKPPLYFESHPNDSRVTGPHRLGNTVSARYGTGGGNAPIVLHGGPGGASLPMESHEQGLHASRIGLQRSSGDTDRYFRSAGFGNYAETIHGGTLTCSGGDTGLGGGQKQSSVGFDQHNLNLTYSKAMTLLNARADGHSIPTVFQKRKR